jgi:Family of unknown function (DUF5709)
MSEFGDQVYEAGSDPDDDQTYAVESEDTLAEIDTDELAETDWSPPDRPPKATRYGTTELEQLEGETLDQRLAEEEPEVFDDPLVEEDVSPRAGRLVAPDEGAHVDDEPDLVATDVGPAGYASSAEEAAMHVVDEDAPEVEG